MVCVVKKYLLLKTSCLGVKESCLPGLCPQQPYEDRLLLCPVQLSWAGRGGSLHPTLAPELPYAAFVLLHVYPLGLVGGRQEGQDAEPDTQVTVLALRSTTFLAGTLTRGTRLCVPHRPPL